MSDPNCPLTESQLRTLASQVARLIEEEFAPNGCEIASRWKGGQLVLRPNNDSQPKEVAIEIFFRKLLTIRDSLRLIEQKIVASEAMDPEDKASVQSYVSRAYGALTSFNVLFRNEGDKFVGQGRIKETEDDKATRSSKVSLPKSPLNEF